MPFFLPLYFQFTFYTSTIRFHCDINVPIIICISNIWMNLCIIFFLSDRIISINKFLLYGVQTGDAFYDTPQGMALVKQWFKYNIEDPLANNGISISLRPGNVIYCHPLCLPVLKHFHCYFLFSLSCPFIVSVCLPVLITVMSFSFLSFLPFCCPCLSSYHYSCYSFIIIIIIILSTISNQYGSTTISKNPVQSSTKWLVPHTKTEQIISTASMTILN